MIVTFHVALYVAYQIWERYLRAYLQNTDVNDTNNVEHLDSESAVNANPNPQPIVASEPVTEPRHVESNITFEPNSEPSSALNHDVKSQQEEGYGDVHSCLYYAKETFEPSDKKKKPIDQTFSCIYAEGKEIRFIPPAYTQRYMVIEDVLKDEQWKNIKKVVDFGCAELSFEGNYLRRLSNIQEIVAVDIDFEKLDYNKCKLIPNAIDHIDPRPTPLAVHIYCGSVGHTNEVLKGADAVIAIELIEHLFPPDLECLAFTVFGFICPKIAMFTTPNADFNVLFPNFSGFRHWDHKFEWTREQFEDWGNNLVMRYPEYSVSYRGVTPGPPGSEHLGCLSQMATFVKIGSPPPLDEKELNHQDGSYKLVQKTDYPYFEDKRTQSEIIRDNALSFIQKCTMLRRFDDYSDENQRKKIPLKNIMERIKFYNKKKLIAILTKEDFEIKTNSDGYDVLILPDSDYEDESFQGDYCDDSSNDPEQDITKIDNCHESVVEENWDCDWSFKPQETTLSDAFFAAETAFNEKNLLSSITRSDFSIEHKDKENSKELEPYKSYEPHSACDVRLFTSTNVPDSGNSTKDMSLEEAHHETLIIDDSLVSGFCDKLSLDSFGPNASVNGICSKDNTARGEDADREYSVYETPFDSCFMSSSKCELYNPSAQSLYHSESTSQGDCKRELLFDSPKDAKEIHSDSGEPKSMTDLSMLENICSLSTTLISSPLESSYYATPSCSDIHKRFIPKCLSLQQINDGFDSSGVDYESGKCLISKVKAEKKDNISKSMDGFKSQESCDIHETCSNTSRIIDSGYPDSYSEHNMDLDSIDDIETQSEGEDLSSHLPSPVEPIAPLLPQRVVDNVENGDVANNNRDGEGNNMVADMEEDFFEFEAQIEEAEVPNLALPLAKDIENLCQVENVMITDNLLDVPCASLETNCSKFNLPDLSSPHLNGQTETLSISDSLKELPIVEEGCHMDNNKIPNKPAMKSTQSDSSIGSKSTWSHLDSSESMPNVGAKQGNQLRSQCDHSKIGGYNSLTTVLEGCSKFSDCSLVYPIDTRSSPREDGTRNFPNWMLNMDCSVFQDGGDIRKNYSCDSLRSVHQLPSQGHLSSLSMYQSLSNTSFESDSEDNMSISFPRWLLDIEVSETEESVVAVVNSDFSVWDAESDNDLSGVPFDVQVDARGGGDPQRDSWFD